MPIHLCLQKVQERKDESFLKPVPDLLGAPWKHEGIHVEPFRGSEDSSSARLALIPKRFVTIEATMQKLEVYDSSESREYCKFGRKCYNLALPTTPKITPQTRPHFSM